MKAPLHFIILGTVVSLQIGLKNSYVAAFHHCSSNFYASGVVNVPRRCKREPISGDIIVPQFVSGRKKSLKGKEKDDEGDDDDVEFEEEYKPSSYNVLGTSLKPCCCDVRGTGIGTGFYRNGFCSTGDQDLGRHTVCVQVTEDFLQFSASVGNDLSTPMPEYNFPGLRGGDRWCLCAARWVQAFQAGKAPQVLLESTHEKTLSYAPLDILREYAMDKDESDDVLEKLNKQREQLNRLL